MLLRCGTEDRHEHQITSCVLVVSPLLSFIISSLGKPLANFGCHESYHRDVQMKCDAPRIHFLQGIHILYPTTFVPNPIFRRLTPLLLARTFSLNEIWSARAIEIILYISCELNVTSISSRFTFVCSPRPRAFQRPTRWSKCENVQ